MTLFQILAVLISLAAFFSYINHRLLKLPTTIGLMVLALALSIALVLVGFVYPAASEVAEQLIAQIDFDEALLHGMLGFLLFAGALFVNLDDLMQQRFVVAVMATLGVLVSTFIIGGITWLILRLVGIEASWIYCLIFGSLISPTDPIAVLAIVKQVGAPRSLEVKIAGESLFNDGVSVVIFLTLLSIAGLSAHPEPAQQHQNAAEPATAAQVQHDAPPPTEPHDEQPAQTPAGHVPPTAGDIALLFLQETVGGALFGLAIGYIAFAALKSVDNFQVEVMISLALVTGGYALAEWLHLSAPIAMVTAGLLIGNRGRSLAMSDSTREHLDHFWELIDEILNAVLFVLIGLELLVLTFEGSYVIAGLLAIPTALLGRSVVVGMTLLGLRWKRDFTPHAGKVLIWGGLRGGISVALALSLRESLGARSPVVYEAMLVMTYLVVVFSIIVQGLTIGPMLRWLGLRRSAE